MECGIVGLPNVGKTTLFNALTEAKVEAANYLFSTVEPNVGVINVPDPRLGILKSKIETKKVIPANVRLVDIAGLGKGASEGAGLGNKFLSHIREVDALLQVVRCFEDPDVIHVDNTVDPVRDIETLETELIVADLQVVEGILDKNKRVSRSGDKEAIAKVAVLEKARAALDNLKPVRSLEFTPEEARILRGLGMITAKPILYVANVDEKDPHGTGALAQKVRDYVKAHGASMIVVCAKLEAELVELPEADRAEMLQSLGMEEPALAVVARAAYALLGLQSFYTAGPKEIRAWTIHKGDTAPQAAGAIHTDFEKGFIRAECYSVDDLVKYGSEKAIKDAGKWRSEGRNYVMHDADVVHFLFNV